MKVRLMEKSAFLLPPPKATVRWAKLSLPHSKETTLRLSTFSELPWGKNPPNLKRWTPIKYFFGIYV